MTMVPAPDSPALGELADADDQLGWDREKHGKMIDYADYEARRTVPWSPEDAD